MSITDGARWTGDGDAVLRTARKVWACRGDGARIAHHAPTCPLTILPGARYVEYLGEAAAYESGSHHSMQCALHFGYIDLGDIRNEGS